MHYTSFFLLSTNVSCIRCAGQSLAEIPFEELRLRCNALQPFPANAASFPLFVIVSKLRRCLKDGFLGEGMFFPRIIWVQDGAKLTGFKFKLRVFRLLAEKLKEFNSQPVPVTQQEVAAFEQRLAELETICFGIQAKLRSNFDTAEPIKKKMAQKSKFRKFWKNVVTIAKSNAMQMVKHHLSASEVTTYTQCILQLFNELHNEDERTTSLSSFFVSLKGFSRGHVVAPVESFFRLVVCKLIAKDIVFFTCRYIRKTTNSFLNIDT